MCSLPCTTIGIPLVYYSLKNKTFFDIALGELSESKKFYHKNIFNVVLLIYYNNVIDKL